MGNQTSSTKVVQAASLDVELPKIGLVPTRTLSSHATFSTFLCSSANATHVVVKSASRDDVGIENASYQDAMCALEEQLAAASTGSTSHVWANQQIIETTQAVHVVRQYFAQTLASRPFFTTFEEKLWIAWQILRGLRDAHAAGVCHGDIKPENVMLTSWGWVYLVDFSGAYKPVYLDKENPTAFRVFFDTTGRRKCCIAPERFVKGGGYRGDACLQPEMDVFSVGCVLAELFSDGSSVLKYSDLGRCDEGFFCGVDPRVRTIVTKMLSEDPTCRPTVEQCLEEFLACCEGIAAEADFDAMEVICGGWCDMTPAFRVSVALERTHGLIDARLSSSTMGSKEMGGVMRYDGDGDDENTDGNTVPVGTSILITEIEDIAKHLTRKVGEIMDPTRAPEAMSRADPAPPMAHRSPPPAAKCPSPAIETPSEGRKNGLSRFMAQNVAVALAALVRPSSDTVSKLMLLDRLEKLSAQAGHRLVSRVILPHFVYAATDKQRQQPRVQYFALTTLPAIMSRSNLDMAVVADYVMPALSLVPNDGDVCLRSAYAVSIGNILVQGIRDRGSDLSSDPGGTQSPWSRSNPDDPCEPLKRIRSGVERGVHDILVDVSSMPKLALLENLEDVARGLGPDVTLEGLLPALLTLFNARQDEVRASMYRSLISITKLLGSVSVPFILPFLDRLVSGPEIGSIVSGIRLLAGVVDQGILAPRDVMRVFERLQCLEVSLSPAIQGEIRRLAEVGSEILGSEVAEAMLSLMLMDRLEKRGMREPASSSARPPDILVSGCELQDDEDAFVMPANLACYSVDLDGDQDRQSLLHSTKPPALASPSLITSPSFRKKRVEPLGFPSFSDEQRKGGPRSTNSPTKATRRQRPGPSPPTGVLVARIPCHARSITGISENIGYQSTLFVTSSKDGSCKLWDSRKLERDIHFQARATYLGQSRSAGAAKDGEGNNVGYLCCTTAPAASIQSAFLAGRSDGRVDAWDVEREASMVDSWQVSEGSDILDMKSMPDGKTCIMATACQSIVGVDLRTRTRLAWSVDTEPSLGVPMCIGIPIPDGSSPESPSMAPLAASAGSPYFVTGMSRSYLTVWDTRFMLPVATWRNPASAPILAMHIVNRLHLGPLQMDSVSPTSSGGPVAIVSCGEEEISGWDLSTGACVLAMGRSERPGALKYSVMDNLKPAEDPVGLSRQMGALELRSLSIKRTTIRAMAFVAGDDDHECLSILSGGMDRDICLWNPRMRHGNNASTLFASSAARHRDAVTALRHVRGLGVQPLLASASADGVLNVWK